MSVNLGLLFLLLSGVFTFGWVMGSALGYRNGQHDAVALARLQGDLPSPIDLDLAAFEHVEPVVAADRIVLERRPASRPPELVPERGVVTQGRLLETV